MSRPWQPSATNSARRSSPLRKRASPSPSASTMSAHAYAIGCLESTPPARMLGALSFRHALIMGASSHNCLSFGLACSRRRIGVQLQAAEGETKQQHQSIGTLTAQLADAQKQLETVRCLTSSRAPCVAGCMMLSHHISERCAGALLGLGTWDVRPVPP